MSGYILVVDRDQAPVAIQCLLCGRTSYHPQDVHERYCGACHRFHDDHRGRDG